MLATFVGTPLSRPDWDALRDAGLRISFLDLSDILANVSFTPGQGFQWPDRITDALVGGGPVLYHPGQFDLLSGRICADDTELRFGARQVDVLIELLEEWIGHECHCIDPPGLLRWHSNKARQLHLLAQAVPRSIPPTRIAPARNLDHKGWVLKHLSESRAVTSQTSLWVQEISDRTLAALASTQPELPLIAQQKIETATEYRSLVVSNEVVTVEIDRSSNDEVDVHVIPGALERSRVARTPAQFLNLLPSIKTAVPLRLMAIDYAVVGDEAVLFEINPLFSWAWMPAESRQDFADALATLFTACHEER